MNMDQKQKQISGSRFNIFDFLIIVGVIVCLAAIAARILFIGNEKKKVVYADVYFEISGISDVTADAIGIPNESIYLQSNDIRVGVMNETQAEAQKILTDNGSFIIQIILGAFSVIGTLLGFLSVSLSTRPSISSGL